MKLTPDDIAVLEAFLTEWSDNGAKAAGACIGTTADEVCNIVSRLRKIGVVIPLKNAKVDVDVAAEMRAAGVTDASIARHFGVSRAAIFYRLGPKNSLSVSPEQFFASRKAAK